MIVSRTLGILILVHSMAWAGMADPVQPTGLTASHRSGQSFVTWTELANDQNETYRVYRFDQPITAGNLDQASLLYEVPRDSSRFYADRYNVGGSGVWAARYLDRYVIADGGFELSAGTGLLVWTLADADFTSGSSGDGYYAVTTVDSGGVENRTDFSTENTLGPVAESVESPLPVEVAQVGDIRIFIQYMDLRSWNPTFHAPNGTNSYFGFLPFDPAIARSIQYAYTYTLVEPESTVCGGSVPGKLPLILFLHPWQSNSYPPQTSPANYCAIELRPVDTTETWWFGFARDHDYRVAGALDGGEVIANFTERRVLRMIYDLQRHPELASKVDWNRVYLVGHSMGGSGVLALALRYPQIFAAAYSSEPMTRYATAGDGGGTNWDFDLEPKWGTEAQNLPIDLAAPGEWGDPLQVHQGTGVWDWQDHQAQMVSRRAEEAVPIGIGFGSSDTTIEWITQGDPSYGPLHNSWQSFGANVSTDGHVWQDFQGLTPTLDVLNGVPFFGLGAVRDETVPALSLDVPVGTVFPNGVTEVHQNIEWSSSWNPWDGPPIDVPLIWRMSFRTTDSSTQFVRITPRRLQRLMLDPTGYYRWINRRTDGTVVGTGQFQLDGEGLLTLPNQEITPNGNRITIVLELQRAR